MSAKMVGSDTPRTRAMILAFERFELGDWGIGGEEELGVGSPELGAMISLVICEATALCPEVAEEPVDGVSSSTSNLMTEKQIRICTTIQGVDDKNDLHELVDNRVFITSWDVHLNCVIFRHLEDKAGNNGPRLSWLPIARVKRDAMVL